MGVARTAVLVEMTIAAWHRSETPFLLGWHVAVPSCDSQDDRYAITVVSGYTLLGEDHTELRDAGSPRLQPWGVVTE